jgi:hypothetical protein
MTDKTTPAREVTVQVTDDILYAALSELYNSGHVEWIATDGTTVMLENPPGTPCDECGEFIPDKDDGSMDNKHHAPRCSLYNADKD